MTQQHGQRERTLHALKKTRDQHSGTRSKETDKTYQCKRCGTKHKYKDCPAFGKSCRKCGAKGHFASQCFSQQSTPNPSYEAPVKGRQKKVHAVDENEEMLQDLFIGTLSVDSCELSWYEELSINKKAVKFKLDTGAEANVLPRRLFRQLNSKETVKPTKVKLSAYGENTVKPDGKVNLSCKTKSEEECILEFYIVDVNSPPILGLSACIDLGLVQRNVAVHQVTRETLLEDYSDNFSGLGLFAGKYHIDMDESVKPVIHPPRKVPYSMHGKLKETLDKMIETDVIAKVEQATDWVNSLVIVEKSDSSLRLCLDPKDLNQAIKREHFKIPTPEDIAAQLSGKKVFSILDEKDSYWQVELDDESSLLCTFNTPFGRYRFKRMPFGISSASEVFQRKNQETFGDIQGVQMVSDDMIIAGEDDEDHDRILMNVMKRAREAGVKFNKKKIQLKVTEVKYLGNIITDKGMRPDEEKVRAILEMPTPENKQDIQRFLGTINFLSQYIPNMSNITAPLRQLLKKETQWTWEHEHEEALTKLKVVLTSNPVLRFFDVQKPVTIQADASQYGLGACLFQDNHPIVYTSRALTSAESNYAQIEKELLAIVFACEKFNQYIYGKVVKVESDHKPLETILRKPLSKASPRLQRMMMRLQKYQLDVIYVPGKYMYVADTLSRAFLPEHPVDNTIEEESNIMIHTVKINLPVSAERYAQLQEASRSDRELQELCGLIRNGWPVHKWNASPISQSYWNMRDELHEIDGLVFSGEKLIIPKRLRPEMLKIIHEGHLGMEKCKSRAREILYWPGMSTDIEDIVSRCETCTMFRRSNSKEPMIPHDVPNRRWEKVGVDIFEFDSKDYLLMVDYFSKFIEISLLKDKTADTVIYSMKSIMARHGIPDVVVSDNMPFGSSKFQHFAQTWEFEHVTSSPTYAQSNGMAERAIQTVKQILKKAQEEGKDYYLALLNFRNSPVSGMNASPAQLLMSRSLKTKLPTSENLLQPQVVPDAREQLARRQTSQAKYYNRGVKELPPLEQSDLVSVQRGKTWEPGTVSQVHQTPRSFIVTTESGSTLRRNRRDLHKVPQEKSQTETLQQSTPDNLTENNSEQSVSQPTTRAGRVPRRPGHLADFVTG